MLKIGQKVVPHSKSVGCSLNNSEQWERAQASGQNFLYVTCINEDRYYWCAFTKDDEDSERFFEDDLEPYIKEKSEEKQMIYTVGFISKLLKDGILKEDDAFIVRRV